MALRFYDIATDEQREPTQFDIDELCEVRAAYGRLVDAVAANGAELREKLKVLRSKAGLPYAVEGPRLTGDL